MKQGSKDTATVSDHALEMIMRDVLDGLLELSLESAYASHSDDLQILEITAEQPNTGGDEHPRAAEVIHFPTLRRACG